MKVVGAFLIPLFLLLSCSQPKETGNAKTVFRYNESKGITSLDPAFARSISNIWAVNQLFNGLVQLDNKLEVQPCIAKSWEISKDGLFYTFHLRNDVYFHDDTLFPGGKGRRVTASDFVYSFNRIVDDKTLSPGKWIFNYVEQGLGIKDLGLGSGKSNQHSSIPNPQSPITNPSLFFNAINDSTLQIKLKKSFPPFLRLLSMQYCSVVPKEVVEHYGQDFRTHPVGTGPFKFKFWYEGIKLVFHKNERYFETGLPYLDAVSILFINDPQTAFLEFVKGSTDMLSGLDDGSYKDAIITKTGELQPRFKDKLNMESGPFLNTEYFGFVVNDSLEMVKKSPLRMKAVRQAINYGIDRKKMIRYIRNNIGTPGLYGFVPEGLPSFDTVIVKGYNYNPDKARDLLTGAGYPGGKGLPEIVLFTTAQYLDLCEYIQHSLLDIGIKLKVEVNSPAVHGEMIARSQAMFFRKSWVADYADAENYLALFYSKNFTPSGPNYTLFSNKKFDMLYEKALVETNDSVRYSIYKEMDNIIMEESPVVVLYYDRVLRFSHKNITGLEYNPMNLLSLKKVKKGI